MLHAELHGKLSSDVGDGAELLEDVLTSTVFGTLFAASAWDVITDWLSRARRGAHVISALKSSHDATDYWFWPWLDKAEPDLVVQLGATLIVIEAKYLSGKSGPSTPHVEAPVEEADSNDQLVRQWRAIGPTADSSGYEPRLRALVTEPATHRILIYLVRRSHYARGILELEQSLAQKREARMYLLTWEDLDEVLESRSHLRWASELRRYLARRRIAAFRGFGRAFNAAPSRFLHVWMQQRTRMSPSFIDVIHPQAAIAQLARRSSNFAPDRDWSRVVRAEAAPLLHQLAYRPSRFPEQ